MEDNNMAARLGRIGIVGAGNMGQAICAGLLGIEGVEPESICVSNPGEEKRKTVQERFGVATTACNTDVLPAQTLVLAVKPAKIEQVAAELAQAGIGEDTLVISVAAGVSTKKLSEALGGHANVVRVMPNTPLTCGVGMSGLSAGAQASPQSVELARQVFASMGDAVVVPEDKQDVVTAISGSGPAYFELFVQSMANAGVDMGLDYESAKKLALQTMLGTASMLAQTGQDLDEAIKAVSSPGGTTVAALDAMRSAGVDGGIAAGVHAAAKRSAELGG